jgi:hypothetical protein
MVYGKKTKGGVLNKGSFFFLAIFTISLIGNQNTLYFKEANDD